MKKHLIILLLLITVVETRAENVLSVGSALIPQGKSGSFSIELSNPDDAFCAFQMDVELPNGINFVSATKGSRFTAQSLGHADQGGNVVRFTSIDTENNDNYKGESGVLFSITVEADAGLAVGEKLNAKLSNIEFARKNQSMFRPDDVDFQIEITDKIILDENSTIIPTSQENANVLVKRTIKGGVWNTICLPFDMEANQVRIIFGDDVEFCEFDSWNEVDNAFIVNFTSFDIDDNGFYGNWPYLIKTSNDITEFSIDGVELSPDEDDAIAEYETGKGKNKKTIGTFTGTLKSSLIPNDNLFLYDNKFYYSTGTTTIKGFRGYFWIDGFSHSSAAPEMIELKVFVDGSTTKVEGLNVAIDSGQYYNLNGVKVTKASQKGIYIKDGKKVIVK